MDPPKPLDLGVTPLQCSIAAACLLLPCGPCLADPRSLCQYKLFSSCELVSTTPVSCLTQAKRKLSMFPLSISKCVFAPNIAIPGRASRLQSFRKLGVEIITFGCFVKFVSVISGSADPRAGPGTSALSDHKPCIKVKTGKEVRPYEYSSCPRC